MNLEMAVPPNNPDNSSKAGTSREAIFSLILGVLGCGLSFITGIPGLVLGLISLSKIQESKLVMSTPIKGRGLAITGVILSSFNIFMLPVAIALLLPAVQQSREAARRSSCGNKMKQIGLGIHNYADKHQTRGDNFFPTDICSDIGLPLLSWRVAILPHIEERELYQKFHLNESWDSPHNILLLKEMPSVYLCPSAVVAEGKTTYWGVKGDSYTFDASLPPTARGFTSMRDGTSNTVSVVEMPLSYAVEWTKPDSLMPDPETWMNAPGSHAGGVFCVLFADGSSSFFSKTISPESLRGFFTINAGDKPREY